MNGHINDDYHFLLFAHNDDDDDGEWKILTRMPKQKNCELWMDRQEKVLFVLF